MKTLRAQRPAQLLAFDNYLQPIQWDQIIQNEFFIQWVCPLREPMRFVYTCSTDISERPPNSQKLPELQTFELHEWVQSIEQRSLDSLKPVHSQIMQLSRLRMHQLAWYMRITIKGFRSGLIICRLNI